ncbi:hypothetical protein [Amnibacterium kyonggiense]
MRKITKTVTTTLAAAGLLIGAGAVGSAFVAPANAATSTIPAPTAQIPVVSGKTTQVALDAGFLKALTTLKLTPGVIGGATLSKSGTLTFPITGGFIDYWSPSLHYRPYVQGNLLHEGSGISLTAGGKKVSLEDFVIHPGNDSYISGTVLLNGKTVGTNVDIFRLDGSTLNPVTQDSSGDYVLKGTTVYVSDDAAALLNKTYGTTAVTGSLKVGIATLTVK